MRSKQELIVELKKVMGDVSDSPGYAQRNSNKGYLRGLMYALGIDVTGKVHVETVLTQCGLVLDFKDKDRIERKMPEVFA
jgi:hypothetical protein